MKPVWDWITQASMKAPPKRKGNAGAGGGFGVAWGLNESPSKKEGKSASSLIPFIEQAGLNESPSKKEGKSPRVELVIFEVKPPQ